MSGRVEVYVVDHLDCGCVVVLDTRVVVFSPHQCSTHRAGQVLPDDYPEWVDLGEPVG